MSDKHEDIKPIWYINNQTGERQVCYTSEDIERWHKEGKLPSHLRDYHFQSLQKTEQERIKWKELFLQRKEFKEQNPNATDEEINQLLGFQKKVNEEEQRLLLEDFKYSQEFFDFLFENQKILEVDIQPQEDKTTVPELFRDTDHTKIFKITKAVMDRIYHLPTLLEKASFEHIHKTSYRITSSLLDEKTDDQDKKKMQKRVQKKSGSVGQVSISYDFIASSKEEAQKIFEDYKSIMRGEGIKILMAYWKNACLKGRFIYHTSLTEVMRHISDEDREAFFSVKEKTNFWRITRLIENTKLNIVVSIPYDKKGKKIYKPMSFEFRLLEVEATEKTEDEKAYPNETIIRVLDTAKFQTLSQIGTSIKNETLHTHYQDVFLAVSLQTRKAQTESKLPHNTYDEDFLIERANLSNTAKTNKSVARSKLKRKLESFKEDGIIENYEKSGGQYIIEISPQREDT